MAITVRGSRVYTQRLGYGPTGQRTTHRLVAGAYDQTTTWGYNEYGQLTTLTPPGQPTATTLAYNADGLNIGRYAPGLAFTTGFSGAHAPSGLSYGVPALNREYGYEPTTGFLNTRIQADSAREYTYDPLGQLWFIKRYAVADPANDCGQVVEATGEISEICKTRRSGGLLTHSFAYDALGNRTDHGGSYYESKNRQTWFDGRSYSHDADGNRTFQNPGTAAAVQFRWSATGELTAVLRSVNWVVQDSTTFTYDGFGRRITKTSSVTGAHEYLLDGDNLLAELDAMGAIRTGYTSYPGIDTPHSVLVASTGPRYNMATEAPGSVSGPTSQTGALVASWAYDPWGGPTTLRGGHDPDGAAVCSAGV